MVMMEGILWKWTNYLSGWQPRWFVLDYGVLAYYRSQEDVHQGSRGSIKMSCCEILINNSDPVRIDLKVPPETFIYLKASTAAERQKWLVALGTSKACLVDTNYQEQQQQLNSMSYAREKMKELLLCRGIILDQVHQIKSHVTHNEENQVVQEASTILSATCDTFVSNLEDIIEIIEDNLSTFSESPVSTPSGRSRQHQKKSQSSTPPTPSSVSSLTESKGSSKPSTSSSFSYEKDTLDRLQLSSPNSEQSFSSASLESQTSKDSLKNSTTHKITTNAAVHHSTLPSSSSSPNHNKLSDKNYSSNEQSNINLHHGYQESPYKTNKTQNSLEAVSRKSIFGSVNIRFEDVHFNESGLIPTQIFLDACSNILPVFDSLGSTTFAPVKIDIQGNIKKIQLKYDTDIVAFEYLQNIVFQEIKSNETTARNSTTDALLWLKRALEFIHTFLSEVSSGNKDLPKAADIAYSKTLKKFHGWMVRGVFALALKACPYYENFIQALSKNGAANEQEVIAEMSSCVEAMGKIVGRLNSYYKKNKLDNDAVI